MGDPLKEYIEQQLKNGYSLGEVRGFLVRYGYQPQLIDYKIQEIVTFSKAKTRSPMLVTIAVLLIIIIGSGGYFLPKFFGLFETPRVLLDLNVDPVRLEAEPGEEIIFIKSLDSLGTQKRYDVFLEHTAVHIDTGSIVSTKAETVAVETKVSTQTRMLLPESAPIGSYLLSTHASYGGEAADASFLFTVVTKEPGRVTIPDDPVVPPETKRGTCSDGLRNQDETGIDCGGICAPCAFASCSDGLRNQDETGIDCGGICPPCVAIDTEVTVEKHIAEAIRIAIEDPMLGIDACDQMPISRDADECVSEVAFAVRNNHFCTTIKTAAVHDSCLMRFAIDGDYSVCKQIRNVYMKNSCFELATSSFG
ncbi:MAG: hypothetical protein ABIC95_05415 [archaeon]